MTLRIWDTNSRRCIRQIAVAKGQALQLKVPPRTLRDQFKDDSRSKGDKTTLAPITSALAWSSDARTIIVTTTWWPDARYVTDQGYMEGTPRLFVKKVTWPQGAVTTLQPPEQGAVYDMQFVGRNQLIVAGSSRDSSGEIIGALAFRQGPAYQSGSGWTAVGYDEGVNAVALSPDGGTLAAAGSDTAVHLWDWQRGVLKQTLKRKASAIVALAWSPDGRRLLEVDTQRIAVWDVAKRQVLRTWKGLDVYSGEGNSAAWSPDGTMIVVGSEGGGKICNVQSGACREPSPNIDIDIDIDVTDNTSRLFGPFIWGKTGLWETNMKTDPQTLRFGKWLQGRGAGSGPVHDGTIFSFDFFDDEKRMVTVGGDGDFEPLQVKIWNVGQDVVERTLQDLPLSPRIVKLAPDGKKCILGSHEGEIAVIDLTTLQVLWKGFIGSVVRDFVWSRDGRAVFVAGLNGRITLWMADGKERATFLKLPVRPLLTDGHINRAGQEWVAWIPQGHYTGSSGVNQHIRWLDKTRLYPGSAFASLRKTTLNLP